MKMSFTKIMSSMVAMIMIFSVFTGVSFAASKLQDGQYTIQLRAINATTGEPSMADNAITKPVKLEVKNGTISMILEMADSMYDLAVENGAGGFALAEELSENTAAKTFTYKFQVKSIDEPVLMETVVAAMGRKVNFKLAFDRASLVNVTPKASTPTSTSTSNSSPASTVNTTSTTGNSGNTSGNVPNPKTGDNAFTNLSNIIFLALGLSAAVYGVHRIKEKENC